MIAVFFGSWGLYSLRILRKIPLSSIRIDADGIWPAHKNREQHLIPWQAIADVRERGVLQRMELLGINGEVLLRIDYQLAGFEELRDRLVERIELDHCDNLPARFAKPLGHHLFYGSCLVFFGGLGGFAGQESPIFGWAFIAIMFAATGYQYLAPPWRLSLDANGWTAGYVLWSRHLGHEDIAAVELGDTFYRSVRHPEVRVFLKNARSPIKLRGLGVSAVRLYKTLTKWVERAAIPSSAAGLGPGCAPDGE